jgi:RHS repeat-associated protein
VVTWALTTLTVDFRILDREQIGWDNDDEAAITRRLGFRLRRATDADATSRRSRRSTGVLDMKRTSLIVVWLLLALPASGFTQLLDESGSLALVRDLAVDLRRALDQVRAIRGELQSGPPPAAKLAALSTTFDRIRAADLLSAEQDTVTRARLRDHGASAAVLGRHLEVVNRYRNELDRLYLEIDEMQAAIDPFAAVRLKAALDALVRHLDQTVAAPDRTPLGVTLPFRSLDLPAASPAGRPPIVPAYASAAAVAPVAQDTAEGPDVAFTAEILALTRTLHQNPIELFEFVRNQIQTEFYYGAMKGARETLRQKKGNDLDQASLLIALMRASGVPARYVRGTAALGDEQARLWTTMTSAPAVAELLTRAGIPFDARQQGGAIRGFDVEHVWVEAYVSYSNYRGAPLDATGRAWIPLDPSMKASDVSRAVDAAAEMKLDADAIASEYLSDLQSLSPLDFYKKKIADYLVQSGRTLEEASIKRTVRTLSAGLLPSTLPYATVAVFEEQSVVPPALRHTVRFVAAAETGVSFDTTVAVSDLLGRRLTLSYIPATVEDQVAVDAFISLDYTPAYLVKLRPVLKVDGVMRAAGEGPVQKGALHDFSIEIHTPRATTPITNSVVAGGYYAIGLGASDAAYRPPDVPVPADTEGPAADLLYQQAADYLERWNQAEQSLADILHVMNVRPMVSEVMVGGVYNRTVVFGQPQAIEWRGVFMDADLRVSEPMPMASDPTRARAFRRLSGLVGSMLESEVFEQNLEVDSVSAAKLIQLANAGAIPVEHIDAANIAAVLPGLLIPQVIKTDVSDAVRQGWQAIVPRADFNRNIWSGVGYVLLDPATASGGYFISGSLAGASTTVDPHEWVQQRIVDELQHPYQDPSDTDPMTPATIQKVSVTDHQDGIVGEKLPRPLAVWVRDAKRRPVQGVEVTFIIVDGGGSFEGRSTTTVESDFLGVASATPTLGQQTAASPMYVRANPSATYPTQVGENIITASVTGPLGRAMLAAPFQLFAYPGDAHHVVKVLGDGNTAVAGTSAGTVRARVEDRYGNPLSNVPVNFAVQPAVADAQSLPASARNMVVYPSEPVCANHTPILGSGECGELDRLSVETSVFGASVETILGDTVGTTFTIQAEATAKSILPAQTFVLRSAGHRHFGTREYANPVLHASRLDFVNDKGQLLNAAKVGTIYYAPIEVSLSIIEDNFEIESTGQPCPRPTDACYRVVSLETQRTRAVDNRKGGQISYFGGVTLNKADETATVTFNVKTGGGSMAGLVSNVGGGRFGHHLTVGPNPTLNSVEVDAKAQVWIPCVDLHFGKVIAQLKALNAGQAYSPYCEATPEPLGTPFTITHDVFGVRATVTEQDVAVQKTIEDASHYVAVSDVPLPYTIEPAGYQAQLVDVDVFEVDPRTRSDTWIGLLPGRQHAGAGSARIIQGTALDPVKAHETQLVVNRGSAVEIKSDRAKLFVFANSLLTVEGSKLRTRIDRFNHDLCASAGFLRFTVGLDAIVTITLDGSVLTDRTGPPVTYNAYSVAAGTYEIPITPDMVPRPGRHSFAVTAVFIRDGFPGQTLTAVDAIIHEVEINGYLPVGHTVINGVDLLDGHLSLMREDISISGLGPSLQFFRTYGSTGSHGSGPMGAGWSHNYQARIIVDSCGSITLIGGEGSGVRFSQPVPDSDAAGNIVTRFKPQAGYHGTLTQNRDGSFEYFTKERTRYHYDPPGRRAPGESTLAYIEDAHGQRLTLTYAAEAPFDIAGVTDASGRTLTFSYSPFGFPSEARIVRINGPLNLELTFDYDQYGNLKSATRTNRTVNGPSNQEAARTESYEYTTDDPIDQHNLVLVTDPNGNKTRFSYYAAQAAFPGNATAARACPDIIACPEKHEFIESISEGVDSANAAVYGFTYDYSNYQQKIVSTVVNPIGVSTVYTLNPFGNVKETRIRAAGSNVVTSTRWAFDDGINDVYVTASADPNGRMTRYTYDDRGNLTDEVIDLATGAAYAAVTDGDGRPVTAASTHYEYDPKFNKLTRQVDAEGNATVYEIDPANGDRLSRTEDAKDDSPPILTRYTYDRTGRLKTTTDPRGNVTSNTYDAYGNLLTTVNSTGVTTINTYDARSRLVTTHDTLGHASEYSHDALDRLIRVLKVAGHQPSDTAMRTADQVTAYTYFPGGQKQTVTNGIGQVTRYSYDALNRIAADADESVATADGDAHTLQASFTYDGAGRKVREQDKRGIVRRFAYDDLNRPERVEVQDGGTWKTLSLATYDAAGNQLTQSDVHGMQHTTTFEYDRLYRRVRVALPLVPVRSATKTYDRVGHVLSDGDANGHTVLFAYDGLYRVKSRTDPLGNVASYRYDAAGNQLEEITTSGLMTRSTYDGMNRPTSVIREFHDPISSQTLSYETRLTYIDAEHIREIRDARNVTIREQYNGLDEVIEKTVDPGGLELRTTFAFDGNGNAVAIKDPEGGDVDELRIYDGLNRVVKRRFPLKGEEKTYYDGTGNVIRQVDRMGTVMRHEYDVLGRHTADYLVESRTNGGAELRLSSADYDDATATARTSDANRNVTIHYFDGVHRELRTVDPLQQEITAEWDGVNKRAEIDKRRIRREFDYDALNRIVATRELDDAGTALGTISADYADAKNLRVDTDRRGIRRTTQSDALQRVRRLSRSHPALQGEYGAAEIVTEERRYDGNDNLVASIDANGNMTTYAYDAADRRTAVTVGAGSPVAATTTYTYDRAGNVLTVKDGRVTGSPIDSRYGYDGRYRRVSQENGAGELTTYAYDQNDNLLNTTEPKRAAFVTVYAYDELNKLLAVDDRRGGAGGVTRYQYDANRNLIAQQNADGNLTTFSYDALNRQTDRFQHVIAGTLSGGAARTSSGGDRATAQHWHYDHDANGNESLIVDAEAQRVIKAYDSLNRLVRKEYSNHKAAPDGADVFPKLLSIDYAYDGSGNLMHVDETKLFDAQSQKIETTTMAYDHLDRLTTQVNADGKTVRYAYDRLGNRRSVTDPQGIVVAYAYDARNQVATATTEFGGATGTTQYQYWPDGLQKTIAFPNGVAVDMDYDRADRLLTIINHDGDPESPISRYQYGYDANGNRSKQIEQHRGLAGGTVEETSYGYDALNRLSSVNYPTGSISYTYTSASNRLGESGKHPVTEAPVNRQYSYNRLNELLAVVDGVDPASSMAYEYDANGNLVTEIAGPLATGSNGGTHTITRFAYDIRDNLATASVFSGKMTFDYDYLGRRAKMIGPSAQIRYVYDQDAVLQEYDGSSLAPTLKYNYGAGLFSMVSFGMNRRDNSFYLFDGLKSVSELTDEGGRVQASYQYDVWGGTRASFDVTGNRRRYAGEYFDTETNLHLFGARYYDDRTGRFLSQDSFTGDIAAPPSLHRYSYAFGNPTTYTDRNGHSPTLVTGAIGLVVGGVAGCIIGAVNAEDGHGWAGCGKGAAVGAVVGGLAGLTMGISLAGTAGAGMGVFVASGTLEGGAGVVGAYTGSLAVSGTVTGVVGGAAGGVLGVAADHSTDVGALGRNLASLKFWREHGEEMKVMGQTGALLGAAGGAVGGFVAEASFGAPHLLTEVVSTASGDASSQSIAIALGAQEEFDWLQMGVALGSARLASELAGGFDALTGLRSRAANAVEQVQPTGRVNERTLRFEFPGDEAAKIQHMNQMRSRTAEAAALKGLPDVNPLGGKCNCQLTAHLGDIVLSGGPALIAPDVTGSQVPRGFSERVFKSQFEPVAGVRGLLEVIKNAEPGSRAIVRGKRTDASGKKIPGHRWNAINEQGRPMFLDFQPHAPAEFSGYDAYEILWTHRK